MRGGGRLTAVVVAIGLLAGCSNPSEAVRRERAAARTASPPPAAAKKPGHRPAWWQAPGGVKTTDGLKVRTGPLHGGRVRLTLTDVAGHATRTVVASTKPHGAVVGQFTLTGIKVVKSAGKNGVTFRYRHR
jgi:hypothetical protein